MNPAPYAAPLLVTVVYLFVYYASMIHILRVKNRLIAVHRGRGERFDRYFGQDREMLGADRVQLNMLEHMPPFLVLLWLNAVFVSTSLVTGLGLVYLVSRLLYPVMMGTRLKAQPRMQILVATFPGYLVIAAYVGALLYVTLPGLF